MSQAPIDLDALAPATVQVKLKDEIIDIEPPSTGQVLKLASLGEQMQGASEMSQEQLGQLIDKITDLICEVAPALKGKPLQSAQLLRVINIITDSSTPQTEPAKETTGTVPKETPSE
jgi:hypothetical protein